MRTAIYNYLDSLSKVQLGTFTLSPTLPYSASGIPLYLKNFKTIYVDTDQTAQDDGLFALDGSGTVDETTTVRVFFVIDAKQLPSNYESLVELIKDARLTADISGVSSRLVQVDTAYQDDSLTTTFEFSFRKLLTNT